MENAQNGGQHYERADLTAKLSAALAAAGLAEKQLTVRDLAPLDQFHSRGLEATVELAKALDISKKTHVIDIGSGLGGPSRYLADTFGCTVKGVDLSESFVGAASFLAQRTGLAQKVTYQCGDALQLPFSDAAFDLAWSQHVAMNIADRPRLYREAFRVLRAGGHFAIFDVVAASAEPLFYPVPWARAQEMSFVVKAEEMRGYLTDQGFEVSSWVDCTEAGVAWFAERERTQSAEPPSIGIQIVMGPEFGTAARNLRRNLAEGRAALMQAICRKP